MGGGQKVTIEGCFSFGLSFSLWQKLGIAHTFIVTVFICFKTFLFLSFPSENDKKCPLIIITNNINGLKEMIEWKKHDFCVKKIQISIIASTVLIKPAIQSYHIVIQLMCSMRVTTQRKFVWYNNCKFLCCPKNNNNNKIDRWPIVGG